MKNYETVSVNLVSFSDEDVIATSNVGLDTPTQPIEPDSH